MYFEHISKVSWKTVMVLYEKNVTFAIIIIITIIISLLIVYILSCLPANGFLLFF